MTRSSITGEFIYRHHVEPGVKLCVPREESYPPLKYIDVARTTHTSLDVTMDKHIDDHWNVDGERELEPTYKKTKQPPVQTMHGQICGSKCLMQRRRKQNKDGPSRNRSSTMPDNWGEYSSLNQTTKNSSSQWKPLVQRLTFRCQLQCLAKYQWRVVGKQRKTKYACVVDADDSTRPRLEGAVHTYHQDHITEKRMNFWILTV